MCQDTALEKPRTPREIIVAPEPRQSLRVSAFVSACRGVDAAGAGGRRAAPDALVSAVSMAVGFVRRVDAAVSIARASAPLAVLLVVEVLVRLGGTVDARTSVARAIAMAAFGAHGYSMDKSMLLNSCVATGLS